METPLSPSPGSLRIVCVVVMATAWISLGRGQYGCPTRVQRLRHCNCQEKSKGLDIVCDGVKVDQLREMLSSLSQSGQHILNLRVKNSHLVTLPDGLLEDVDIRHVIALNCNISSIDDMAFLGLENSVESLDLAQNVLERVPTEALAVLVNMATLNLNYNQIEILHAEAFKGLISLLRLSLYGNKIKFIDDLAFIGIEGNLTSVNLGQNQLTAVPSKPLKNLTVLQRLQMQENNIAAILSEEFKGIGESLDALEIASNQIEELPERAFTNLRMLSSLDLENNRIRYIHPKAFVGVEESLEWLKLGGNRLNHIPTEALKKLTKLRQLDLRGNNITQVESGAFRPYGSNLKFIYLQKNNLETIEPTALENLNSLEWLYLQSNKLTTAPHKTFSSVLDTLQILDIHDNPFHCDCDIAWFRKLVQGKGADMVSMPRETRCATPPEYHRMAILDIRNTDEVCVSSGASQMAPYLRWTSRWWFDHRTGIILAMFKVFYFLDLH